MITKPFEQWLFEEVELTFEVKRNRKFGELADWLKVETDLPALSPAETVFWSLLNENVETWNEDELKMNFIAPVLMDINFNKTDCYKVFSQRLLSIKTDKVDSQGRVEWFVSAGKQIPREPFFFVHEYKPEKGGNADPLGQLLIAMLASQAKNAEAQMPIYGLYIVGRFWFFVLLVGKEYGVSPAYDSADETKLKEILHILRKTKQYIETRLGV